MIVTFETEEERKTISGWHAVQSRTPKHCFQKETTMGE